MDRKVEVHLYPAGNITWQYKGEQICPPGADCEAGILVDFSAVPRGVGLSGPLPQFDLIPTGSLEPRRLDQILCLVQAGQVSRKWAKIAITRVLANYLESLPDMNGEPVPESVRPIDLARVEN